MAPIFLAFETDFGARPNWHWPMVWRKYWSPANGGRAMGYGEKAKPQRPGFDVSPKGFAVFVL